MKKWFSVTLRLAAALCLAVVATGFPTPAVSGNEPAGTGSDPRWGGKAGLTVVDDGEALVSVVDASAPSAAEPAAVAEPTQAEPVDWPHYRADQQRTGYVANRSDITNPHVLWSYYLGGAPEGHGVLADDVDGDGVQEILSIVGGSVVATTASGDLLWKREVGGTVILGVYDLDGNGVRDIVVSTGIRVCDIVVSTGPRIWIVDGATGEMQWQKTDFPVSSGGYARVVSDLTGDGLPEMIFWNFSYAPVQFRAVHLYTFAGGVANASPVWVWQDGTYESGWGMASGDVDGDGQEEVVLEAFENGALRVHNAATGAVEASIAKPPAGKGLYLRNVDGDPALEVVSIGGYYESWARHVVVYDVAPGAISVKWQMYHDRTDVDVAQPQEDAVADLDADGAYEIVTGVYNHNAGEQKWRTLVWQADAAAPTLLADLVDQYPVGVADIDGDGHLEVLTSQSTTHGFPAFATITAYDYTAGNLVAKWSVPRARAQALYSRPGPHTRIDYGTLAAQDLDGDGHSEVYLLVDADGDDVADRLDAYDGDTGLQERSHAFAGEVTKEVLYAGPVGGAGQGDTLLSANDGYLELLNRSFGLVARVQAGGFQSPLLVTDVDGDGRPSLLGTNSQGQFLNLDLHADPPRRPPSLSWMIPVSAHREVKLVADLDGDGGKEFVVLEAPTPAELHVRLLASDGATVLWTHPFAEPLERGQVAVADLNGSGNLDLFVQLVDPRNVSLSRLCALDGDDGTPLWEQSDVVMFAERSVSVVDVSGDGIADLASCGIGNDGGLAGNNVGLFNGTSGALLWTVADYAAPGIPGVVTVTNLDGDAANELITTGLYQANAYETAPAGAKWQAAAPSNFAPAVVDIDADGDCEVGYWNNNNALTLRDGASGAVIWEEGLYNGTITSTVVGVEHPLGDPAATDVDGDGLPELLLGGADGYLYAVNAEDGSLAWTYDLGYPLGSPIVADVDGDGKVEVLVSAADGYVYALNQRPELRISTAASADTVAAGGALTYTLRLTNTGTVTFTATITDVLPRHVTPGGVLTWTVTLPAPGGAWTEQVEVDVDPGYNWLLTNTLQVMTGEGITATEAITTRAEGDITWLFLVYLNGDNDLADAIWPVVGDLVTASVSSPAVAAVVLWDGEQDGDSALYHIAGGGLASLSPAWLSPEANVGDGQTLVDFVTWARAAYPTNHTLLSILDHGGGWSPTIEVEGGRHVQDVTFPSLDHYRFKGGTGMSWDLHVGTDDVDYLSTAEMRDSLETLSLGGTEPVDVLFYDACLMGMLEEVHDFAPYARFFVASENQAWASNAYGAYLSAIEAATTPAELATAIVAAYEASLQEAGADEHPYTMAALDLSYMDGVSAAFDNLAQALRAGVGDEGMRMQVYAAYSNTQKFDSDSDLVLEADRESYVDLYDLALNLADTVTDTGVVSAAHGVLAAWDAGLVLTETHRSGRAWHSGAYWDLEDAHGLSVYLPLGEELTMIITHTNGLTEEVAIRSLYGPDEAPGLAWQGAVHSYAEAEWPDRLVAYLRGPRPGLLPVRIKGYIYLPLVLRGGE